MHSYKTDQPPVGLYLVESNKCTLIMKAGDAVVKGTHSMYVTC